MESDRAIAIVERGARNGHAFIKIKEKKKKSRFEKKSLCKQTDPPKAEWRKIGKRCAQSRRRVLVW
jgi:hypothetical protein